MKPIQCNSVIHAWLALGPNSQYGHGQKSLSLSTGPPVIINTLAIVLGRPAGEEGRWYLGRVMRQLAFEVRPSRAHTIPGCGIQPRYCMSPSEQVPATTASISGYCPLTDNDMYVCLSCMCPHGGNNCAPGRYRGETQTDILWPKRDQTTEVFRPTYYTAKQSAPPLPALLLCTNWVVSK